MKIKSVLIAIILCANHTALAHEAHRYYYNAYYATPEFSKSSDANHLAQLPKLNQAQAMKKVEAADEVKKILTEDPNYFLQPMESSYTDDDGKTWTDWEIGVARVVMNQTLRVDAIFGVNPFDGKVTRLKKPVISLPFFGE